jgi:hypothetical protein
LRRIGIRRISYGQRDALFTLRPLGPLRDIALYPQARFSALEADRDRTIYFRSSCAASAEATSDCDFEDVHWADEATLD